MCVCVWERRVSPHVFVYVRVYRCLYIGVHARLLGVAYACAAGVCLCVCVCVCVHVPVPRAIIRLLISFPF